MKIGIIDSNRNCYVTDPDIERRIIGETASVTLYQAASADALPDDVRDCDGLISWHLVPLDAAFIGSLRRCRGIVRAAVGFDNIDLEAARRHGIAVANVPDYGTDEVADHALAMALSLLRRLVRGHEVVARGSWDWREVGSLPRLRELHVGVVGCGRIGMAVALRFKALGCRVSIFDPYLRSGTEKSIGVERLETLDQLLCSVDLISIHTPLTDETRHLIGAREMRMLEGKYLVNTARGPIVDGDALCSALANDALKGVALDVYEDETKPIPQIMQGRHDVLLSPHVAFYSEAALPELRAKAAQIASELATHGWHRNVL